jgi:hypothetical protein
MRFQLNVTDHLGQTGTAFINVLDKSTPTFSAPPPVEIKSPITSASVPSNHPNTNSNLANLPAAKNASIPPPLTPPINH